MKAFSLLLKVWQQDPRSASSRRNTLAPLALLDQSLHLPRPQGTHTRVKIRDALAWSSLPVSQGVSYSYAFRSQAGDAPQNEASWHTSLQVCSRDLGQEMCLTLWVRFPCLATALPGMARGTHTAKTQEGLGQGFSNSAA